MTDNKQTTFVLTGPDDVWNLPLSDGLKAEIAVNFELVWNSDPGAGAHKIGMTDVQKFADAVGMEMHYFGRKTFMADFQAVNELADRAGNFPNSVTSRDLSTALRSTSILGLNVSSKLGIWHYVGVKWILEFEEGWKYVFRPVLDSVLLNGEEPDWTKMTVIHPRLARHEFYTQWYVEVFPADDLGFRFALTSEEADLAEEVIYSLAKKHNVPVEINWTSGC
jgi:hypothetical protein